MASVLAPVGWRSWRGQTSLGHALTCPDMPKHVTALCKRPKLEPRFGNLGILGYISSRSFSKLHLRCILRAVKS